MSTDMGREDVVCVCVYIHIWIFCCLVAQSYLTLGNFTDCRLPGSSVCEISQARILEWGAISFSRGSSRPRDWTRVSCSGRRFFTTEPPGKPHNGISRGSTRKTVESWSKTMGKQVTAELLLWAIRAWSPKRLQEEKTSSNSICPNWKFKNDHQSNFTNHIQSIYIVHGIFPKR